jgi:hypothetical protein
VENVEEITWTMRKDERNYHGNLVIVVDKAATIVDYRYTESSIYSSPCLSDKQSIQLMIFANCIRSWLFIKE